MHAELYIYKGDIVNCIRVLDCEFVMLYYAGTV